MDLALDISKLAAPGRKAAVLDFEILRPIRGADLALLATTERNVQPIQIKRLSERHHMLARSIAGGMKPAEAGHLCGYSAPRVSILQGDPAFQELVSFYSESKDAAFASMYEQLAGMSVDALLELRERLEDEPEKFSNAMLLELVTKTADRSGHGPSTTSTNLNINAELGDRLELARQRAKAAARGEVIDAEVVEEKKSA